MKLYLYFLTVICVGAILDGCATRPPGTLTASLNANTPTHQAIPSQTPAPNHTPSPQATLTATTLPAPISTPAVSPLPVCQLTPIVIPTMAVDPGYTQLDTTTGLHMTGQAQSIDLATYRLKVTGMVDHPLSLGYDDLRCMPKITSHPALTCPGFFEDVATWSGVPINYILGLAGVQNGAEIITLVAADGYENWVWIKDALKPENFLAYEWEGQPLPVLHGFPLRAVIPDQWGNKWVKWLLEIRVEGGSN
jgi:DMSO/TMAO reductase YedYZ molybdopterin-dependent catalytic subunit